jgi:putative transposase
MIYAFIKERCSDLAVSTCCRVMKVSTSGFYQRRRQPVTDLELAAAYAANEVHDIWTMSRHSYGSPRIRKELRLGRGVHRSKTTCERLMRLCGAVGIHYPNRNRGCTRAGDGEINVDLVNRAFDPAGPDRLWCMDITEHPTRSGKVYLAVVIDAWSRRVVGWSIADHIRAELVADAIQMAT